MIVTVYDGIDGLYHRAKFGEHRTTRAGCRCENTVFVTVFFFCLSLSEAGALFVRGGHSFEQLLLLKTMPPLCCVTVYGSIITQFSTFFSQVIAFSGERDSSHFRCQMAPQLSGNCGQKL